MRISIFTLRSFVLFLKLCFKYSKHRSSHFCAIKFRTKLACCRLRSLPATRYIYIYITEKKRHLESVSYGWNGRILLFADATQVFGGMKLFQGGSNESLSSKGGALTGSDSGVLELSDSGGGGPPGEWDLVPSIVRQCIRHLETTGLRTLGIFRVSPSKKRVRQVSVERC